MYKPTIFAGIFGLAVHGFVPASSAEVFKGFPDIIVCEHRSFDHAYYVDARLRDGSVRYKNLSGRTITVGANGAVRHQNAPCDGMTIKQLKREGRTRVFPNG